MAKKSHKTEDMPAEADEHEEHETPESGHEEHEHRGEQTADDAPSSSKSLNLQSLWAWCMAKKKISIPAGVAVLLVLFFLVPFTRYSVLALFLKQDFPVVVLDSQTGQPVSSAQVSLKGKTVSTDGKGEATLHVPVGSGKLTVSKTYYKGFSQSVTVPVSKPGTEFGVKLEATGRAVALTVTNKISGKPLQNAKIVAGSAEAKTDDQGRATLVIPAGQTQAKATISADGYIQSDIVVKVDAAADAPNKFSLVPTGKMFLLSDASGKIDLVKTNLDGSDRETVLAGTGKEDRFNTVLFASRDWKYIALLSKRDGGDNPKLFLVETDSGKLTNIDEGNAQFQIVGWIDNHFIYTVTRNLNSWDPKRQALKSFDASTKKLTTLDETKAEGWHEDYAGEQFGGVFVVDHSVVYAKGWISGYAGYYSPVMASKQATLNTVQADGSQKKILKSYTKPSYHNYVSLDTRPAEFGEIYVQYDNGQGAYRYDEYANGKLSSLSLSDDEFYNKAYPTYSVSPSGKRILWSTYTDGKNVFTVGDGSGQNGKKIGADSDFQVYGWYTDDYVLLTKKGSEMWIMPADGLDNGISGAVKISDYYKPQYYLNGFGYGYGG
ncbi:MAG TPA: carboxypeptidase regulatory-like domain-containing protein [Candidatus Pristimantibacillus sp.]|nr:carboxypeptidase regulatory-like domain-containing protein [Candidatus Pristimantibacillus sp.]